MTKIYEIEPVWVPPVNVSENIIDPNNGGFYLKIIITENNGALTYEFLRYDPDTKQWIAQESNQNQAWSAYDYGANGKRYFHFDHENQTLYRLIPGPNKTIRCDRYHWNGSSITIQMMTGKEKYNIEKKVKPTFPEAIIVPTYAIEEIKELDQNNINHSERRDLEALICKKDLTSVLDDYPHTELNPTQRQILCNLILGDWEILRAECNGKEKYIAALRHILKGDLVTESTNANISIMRDWLFLSFADKLGNLFHENSTLKRRDLYCFLVACIIDELKHLKEENIEWSKPDADSYNISLSENQAIIHNPNMTDAEQNFLDQLIDFYRSKVLISLNISVNQHGDFIALNCLKSFFLMKKNQPIIDEAMIKVLQTFSIILYYSDPNILAIANDEKRIKKATKITNLILYKFFKNVSFAADYIIDPEKLLFELEFGSLFSHLTLDEIDATIPHLATWLKNITNESLAMWCCNNEKFEVAEQLIQQLPVDVAATKNLFNAVLFLNKGELKTAKELIQQLSLSDNVIDHLFTAVWHVLLRKTRGEITHTHIIDLLFDAHIIKEPLIMLHEVNEPVQNIIDLRSMYLYFIELCQHFYGKKNYFIKLQEFWVKLIFDLDNRAQHYHWFEKIIGSAIDEGQNDTNFHLLNHEFKSKIIAEIENFASIKDPADPCWKALWSATIKADQCDNLKLSFWTSVLLQYHRPSTVNNPSSDWGSLLTDFLNSDVQWANPVQTEFALLKKQINIPNLLNTLYQTRYQQPNNLKSIRNLITFLDLEKNEIDFVIQLIINNDTDKNCFIEIISPYTHDLIDHAYYELLYVLVDKYRQYQDNDGNNLLHLTAKHKSEFLLRAILSHPSKPIQDLIKMTNNEGEKPQITIHSQFIQKFKLGLFCLQNKLFTPALLLDFYEDGSYTSLYEINAISYSHSSKPDKSDPNCKFFRPSQDKDCWIELYNTIHNNYSVIKKYMESCMVNDDLFTAKLFRDTAFAVFACHFKLDVFLKNKNWCTPEIIKLEMLLQENCNLKEVKEPKVNYLVKKLSELIILIANKEEMRDFPNKQGFFSKDDGTMKAEIDTGKVLLSELRNLYNEQLSGTNLAKRLQQVIGQVRQTHSQGFEKLGINALVNRLRPKSKLVDFCDTIVKEMDQYLRENRQASPAKTTQVIRG